MRQLRTIILDDEPDSVKLLQLQLAQHCPQVEVIATYTNPAKALKEIESLKPDLFFLDIEMPLLNGFEILEKLIHDNFSVVFVTAYNQFALKAFRFNALDYLVKPFDSKELIEAVAKAEKQIKPTYNQLTQLQKQLQGEPINKIAIPSNNGVSFIDFNEIIYVEASNIIQSSCLRKSVNLLFQKLSKTCRRYWRKDIFCGYIDIISSTLIV